MEKKKLRKIEAGAAIFVIVAVILILGTGPSIIADSYNMYDHPVHVVLTANDVSPIEFINYSVVCSDPAGSIPETQVFNTSTVEFDLTVLGEYHVSYYSQDIFGNTEPQKSKAFSLVPTDTSPPITGITITEIE